MVKPSKKGIRSCMKCGWKFVSPDILRIGRCHDCQQGDAAYMPKSARVAQLNVSAYINLQKDTT